MVDGVGNDLGFHLHLEACDPPSGTGGTNEISRADWFDDTESIKLAFYGPIRLEGNDFHVLLQRYNEVTEEWVAGADCYVLPVDILEYTRLASGTNTSLNVLKITACGDCGCGLELGEYRIIEIDNGLKSDLGLAVDPDVQPFEYYFTLVQ